MEPFKKWPASAEFNRFEKFNEAQFDESDGIGLKMLMFNEYLMKPAVLTKTTKLNGNAESFFNPRSWHIGQLNKWSD